MWEESTRSVYKSGTCLMTTWRSGPPSVAGHPILLPSSPTSSHATFPLFFQLTFLSFLSLDDCVAPKDSRLLAACQLWAACDAATSMVVLAFLAVCGPQAMHRGLTLHVVPVEPR